MKGKFNYFWLALIDEGSAILPPSQADILQWGIGTTDGLVVNDKKSPLVVDEAAYVNRPVVAFHGSPEKVIIPGVILNSSSSYEITADWSGVTAGRRSGGAIDSTNRMFIQKIDATTLRCIIGSLTDFVDVTYSSGFITLCLQADGKVFVNGVESVSSPTGGSISGTGTYPVAIGCQQSGSSFVEYSELIVANAVIDGRHLTFEETEGTVLYDVSSNDDDGAITTSAIATMRAARADGVSSWNALNGFRLSGTLQIPALADGTAAADGNALTNIGGYISNGADVDIVQTDADEAILGGASFFGDSVTWDEKTRAQWLAHINGTDNLWLQWEKFLGVCTVKKWVQYDITKTLNESEYNQLVRWAGDPTCGDGVVPFP